MQLVEVRKDGSYKDDRWFRAIESKCSWYHKKLHCLNIWTGFIFLVKEMMSQDFLKKICFLSGCPRGYSEERNSCYKLFDDKENYEDAQKECQEDGGYLVVISSEEENQYIKSIIG